MNNSKNISEWRTFFNPVTNQVPLLKVLYYIAIPFAHIAHKLRLSANVVTHLSTACSAISVYFLFQERAFQFVLFQFIALILDLCDGMIARKTASATPLGGFTDHFSDIIKIITLLLAVGIKHDQLTIWILSFLITVGFLTMQILNYQIQINKTKVPINSTGRKAQEAQSHQPKRNPFINFIRKHKRIKAIILGFYYSVFSINANFMIYFHFFFAKSEALEKIMSFMLFIVLLSVFKHFRDITCILRSR